MSTAFEAPVYVADKITGIGTNGYVPDDRYPALSSGVFLPVAFKLSAEADGSIAFAEIPVRNIAEYFAEQQLQEESAWWDGFRYGQFEWPHKFDPRVSLLAEEGMLMEAKEAVAQDTYPAGLAYEIAEDTVITGLGAFVLELSGLQPLVRFSRDSDRIIGLFSRDEITDSIFARYGESQRSYDLTSTLYTLATVDQLVVENITKSGDFINPYYSLQYEHAAEQR